MLRAAWCLILLIGAGNLYSQSVPGLLGEFTDGDRTVRFSAVWPNFYLEPGESIHPALQPAFRGLWRGNLQVLANAAYEFSHDVTVNGTKGRTHTLRSGTHHFSIAYERTPGGASLRLQWKTAGLDWEPVPRSAFSRSASDGTPDAAEQGRWLVHEARCANCHAATGLEHAAPSLQAIGSFASSRWLYSSIRSHHVVSQTEQQSADLTAHLATFQSSKPAKARRANEVAIGKGGELFGTLGCVHCHGALNGLGSKYTLSGLTARLMEDHRPSMMLNDSEATAIAAYLMRSTDAALEKVVPPGDATKGRALFETMGCRGCHEQMRGARPLTGIRSDVCLLVRTEWKEGERAAVRAFLQSPADRSPAPVHQFPFQLRRFQCGACHKPGTEAPPLEGVGEKLKTAWVGEVLWGRKRVRPGRELRMPGYEESAMRPWVASFAKAEGVAPGDGPVPPAFSEAIATAGNGMLGTNPRKKGMSCIGCHDWGEYKSLGEEGPQLMDTTTRMRFDWFERWMRNPARILSGTSMPNYFGALPKERAMESIHTLWAGLALGAKAPVPDGYKAGDLEVTSEARPMAGKEAVIVRWDMPEATPAAIAVGLPGGVSYCFDAGQSRLLYAWRGGFLDMTGTLLRKTDANKLTPTAAIVGDVFWRSAEFPLRMGEERRVPQRRFRGYRLVGGIPVFHYQVDGIDVHEKITSGGRGLVREIEISRVDQPVYFEGRPVPRGTNIKVEVRFGQ